VLEACRRSGSAAQPVADSPQPVSIYRGCDETGCPVALAAVWFPPHGRALLLERKAWRRHQHRLLPYFPLLSGKIF
jgi:hypothetical protein